MALPRSLQPYAEMIEEVSDERREADGDSGYWVYLRPGYIHPDDEVHCVHRDTLRECAREMKNVQRCTRSCCVET